MKLKVPEAMEVSPKQLDELQRHSLTDHLEHGGLVKFPTPPIELPSEEERAFLREETPQYHRRKNVSYYPDAGRTNGLEGPSHVKDRVASILKRHHARVEDLLRKVVPSFVANWTSATCSLRVFEEDNRDLKLRARSDLVHIDAGAYGATRGSLILRFLTNLDAEQDRVWRVKGTVGDLAKGFVAEADLSQPDLLRERPVDRVRHALIKGVSTLVPMARSLDSSPYDRAMRRLHNCMKEDGAFQSSPEGACELRFPPESCWLVFADMTGHACLSGRFCLIDTFLIPKANFRDASLTPYGVLQGLAQS